MTRVLSPPEFYLLGGFGVSVPEDDSDLVPFNQYIVRNPGFAARCGGGLRWQDALGGADVSLGLIGLYGRTTNRELRNVGGGALNTSGKTEYIGLLPSVSLEFPVFSDWTAFVGGGFGVGRQWSDLEVAGVNQARASGTGYVGQVGGGVWAPVGPCTDVGLEGYYYFFDDIKGVTSTLVPYTQEGASDVALMMSLRHRFSNPFAEPSPAITDTKAFETCP